MKLTASTTTPTTTPCLTRGRRPRVIAFKARGPGSSPGILHHHARAGAIGLPLRERPNRTSLPVRPMHLGDVAQFGRALRNSFAARTCPIKGRRRRIIENVEVAVLSTTPAVSTRRADAAWLSLPPVAGNRRGLAGISRSRRRHRSQRSRFLQVAELACLTHATPRRATAAIRGRIVYRVCPHSRAGADCSGRLFEKLVRLRRPAPAYGQRSNRQILAHIPHHAKGGVQEQHDANCTRAPPGSDPREATA